MTLSAFRASPMIAAAAAAGLVLAACAAPAPVTMTTTFTEKTSRRPGVQEAPAKVARTSASTAAAVAMAATGCPINVTEIVDTRRDPTTLGVMAGRALKAPDDIPGWLRSVVGDGLGARGFAVTFADPAAPAGTISAKVKLQNAWVTNTRANKTASVVLLVDASRGETVQTARPYRGSVTLINWASTENEVKDVMSRAFSDALDDMATDLKPLCAA